MQEQGYIMLYRKFMQWEWYKNINVKTLFLHCLLRANYKDTRYQGIELKRGQFITSTKSLSVDTGLSERQVRTALDKLILTSELTSKSNNKYRIITVLKYNDYQTIDNQLDKQVTNERQASDKQVTTDNNIKEVKEVKETNKIPYKDIVDFLNEQSGKSFRHTAKETQRHIKSRFNEGFTFDDFKKVITVMCSKWKNDQKMDTYLRPKTLFGTNFESYLNEKLIVKPERSMSERERVAKEMGLNV